MNLTLTINQALLVVHAVISVQLSVCVLIVGAVVLLLSDNSFQAIKVATEPENTS